MLENSILFLSIGHIGFIFNQSTIHRLWKVCLHESFIATWFSVMRSKQNMHRLYFFLSITVPGLLLTNLYLGALTIHILLPFANAGSYFCYSETSVASQSMIGTSSSSFGRIVRLRLVLGAVFVLRLRTLEIKEISSIFESLSEYKIK